MDELGQRRGSRVLVSCSCSRVARKKDAEYDFAVNTEVAV